MDPFKDFDEYGTKTTRAFITMFREFGELFQFSKDSNVNSDEEVRANLLDSTRNYSGTVIQITAINQVEAFKEIEKNLESMGIKILESEREERSDEHIGDYTSQYLTAQAPASGSQDWDVPHLLVYGSLTPRIEEACYRAFGASVECEDIRNHFVIYGTHLSENPRDRLVDAFRETFGGRVKEQDVVSDIHTSELI